MPLVTVLSIGQQILAHPAPSVTCYKIMHYSCQGKKTSRKQLTTDFLGDRIQFLRTRLSSFPTGFCVTNGISWEEPRLKRRQTERQTAGNRPTVRCKDTSRRSNSERKRHAYHRSPNPDRGKVSPRTWWRVAIVKCGVCG